MSSVSALVDPEEYLLGRKIDKTFELCQQEKAERIRQERINLLAADKLRLIGDPILDLEKRKQDLKIEILSNPIRLKQLRERLLKGELKETTGASKTEPQPNTSSISKLNSSYDAKPSKKETKDPHTHRSRRRRPSPSTPSSSDSTSSSDASNSRSRRHRHHHKRKKHKHKHSKRSRSDSRDRRRHRR